MSRTTRVSLLALALALAGAACGDDDGATADAGSIVIPDAMVDASIAVECKTIREDFAIAIADISRTCGTVDDCALVGALPFPMSCDCWPTVGACSGVAVNAMAFQNSAAFQAAFTFRQFCADAECSKDIPCLCDCAPSELACIGSMCTTQPAAQECLVDPGDAGI